MPTYKVCYFEARGLAEMIRLSFVDAGVEFEDVRYSREEWPKHKADMLFGQMPVLFVDGEQVAHSRAALRFVGRELKIDGGDSLTAAKADMWIEVMIETAMKLPFSEKDEKKKEELTAAVFKDDIIPRLAKLEAAFKGNYIFGDCPTIADFCIYNLLDFFIKSSKADFMKDFPKIKSMAASVESRPKIAKWLKERPVTEN